MASGGGTSASGGVMASPLTSGLTPGGHGGAMGEEPSDLEELEQFARTFKQRRIKLGFTQVGGGGGASVRVLVEGEEFQSGWVERGGASVRVGGGGGASVSVGGEGRSFSQCGCET